VRAKLFWKLGLTYLALLLGAVVAVDWYAEHAVRQDFIRSAEDQLVSLDSLIRSQPPEFDNPAELTKWAAWLAKSGTRVTVIDARGAVLAETAHDPESMENHLTRPEIQQALATGAGESIRHSATINRDLVYRASLYKTASGPIVVRLALPMTEVNEALGEIRKRIFLASLGIIALGAVASLMFSRTFADRIARLKDFSVRVARGDFRPLETEQPKDELTELAFSLNETASRLEGTIQTLTDERNRSGAILRSMVEGVAVIDAREHIVFCNAAFASILNLNASTCEGKPLLEVIRNRELLASVRQALAEREIVRTDVTVGMISQRNFAVTVAPVERLEPVPGAPPMPERRPGAVMVLHDISELRRLERVRQDFVANVSHEFRTPLTAIQGFAETLLAGALEDEDHNRRFVEIIRDHALRLNRLTNDLLRLARIEAGKLELDRRPVSIDVLFESCSATSTMKASQRQLTMKIHCADNLPPVLGDASLLREVLQNLLDNAVQYTPPGGQIEVAVEVQNGEAVITVADTGIGIPLADQERIFERFYRVDAARSREVGGTGLGLSISKHIIEAHGGRIWVESDVGQGSRFHFSIPAAV
jgi:two-component system, OmpR family, phosphate regulon sensor histidine kinase PhoR